MKGDLAGIIEEAKKQGIDLSRNGDEILEKLAYCVSERLLAGDPLKKAVTRCLLEIRHML
jgi:hypothetical protein